MEANFHSLIRGDQNGPWAALCRLGLLLLSLPYALVMRLRNTLFDLGWLRSSPAAIPVVSVGNLTVGGTGKTPCVEHLACFYRRHDLRVAILSRGYGNDEGVNDEALVLEENLPDVPHLQDPNRVNLARIAFEELESEILILDDGFQHRRLRRDLDVVLIDATCPWGFGYCLPRGLLREPASGLRRAHLVIITRCDLARSEALQAIRQRVHRLAPSLPIIETTHAPTQWHNASGADIPLDELTPRPWAALSGIGNPAAFRQTLEGLGGSVVGEKVYPDHHNYSASDVADLEHWATTLPADCAIVTTQKDLVKLKIDRLGGRELWSLQIQLKVISGQDVLEDRLTQLVRTPAC